MAVTGGHLGVESADSDHDIETRPTGSSWRTLVHTFIAPSKAFEDVLSGRGWWLPFVTLSLAVYVYLFCIQHFVGWDVVATNITMHHSGAALQNASPARLQRIHVITMAIAKATMYAYPLIILAFNAIAALVLSATINVAAGGRATFENTLAAWTYAMLPRALTPLLGSLSLALGMHRASFYLDNATGTNIAYYLPAGSAKWMVTLGSAVDLFDLWSLALAAVGLAIVARVRWRSGFICVFGWFSLIVAGKLLYAGLS